MCMLKWECVCRDKSSSRKQGEHKKKIIRAGDGRTKQRDKTKAEVKVIRKKSAGIKRVKKGQWYMFASLDK